MLGEFGPRAPFYAAATLAALNFLIGLAAFPETLPRERRRPFALARANPLVPLLDGTPVLASVTGRHFYVSPDWYGTDDQVPTWNYCLVEIEGVARRLEEPDLRELLDQLSAAQEVQLAPKPAWTAAKMDQDKLSMMLRAIVGFTVDAPVFSGRMKMSQNKSEAERRGTIAALRTLGRHEDADAIESLL